MVNARLHIICGNCGSNDELSFSIKRDFNDFGDYFEDAAIIYCRNCGTLHNLDSTIPKANDDKKDI